ncbi:MAG: hypothetical protein GY934_04920, partial [Gammaproteobacteria bacterium]|nr:hypothetical protein [Gammaproteobacteria bacterium]
PPWLHWQCVNELENSTSLGCLKRAFFAANWLLIEPGERDDGRPGHEDYGTPFTNTPPGNGGLGNSGYTRPRSPSPFGLAVSSPMMLLIRFVTGSLPVTIQHRLCQTDRPQERM